MPVIAKNSKSGSDSLNVAATSTQIKLYSIAGTLLPYRRIAEFREFSYLGDFNEKRFFVDILR